VVDGLLGDVLVVGCHGSNAFADVAHDAVCQNRYVLDRTAVELSLDIGGRDHGMHAGQCTRGRNVDADDARVGVGRMQRLTHERAGGGVVGGVARFAGDFVDAVWARQQVTDDAVGRSNHMNLRSLWARTLRAYHLRRPMENGTNHNNVDPATCEHERWRRRTGLEELVDTVIYIRECTECGRLEIRARSGASDEWHHIGYARA
jgi:hypothetical protein